MPKNLLLSEYLKSKRSLKSYRLGPMMISQKEQHFEPLTILHKGKVLHLYNQRHSLQQTEIFQGQTINRRMLMKLIFSKLMELSFIQFPMEFCQLSKPTQHIISDSYPRWPSMDLLLEPFLLKGIISLYLELNIQTIICINPTQLLLYGFTMFQTGPTHSESEHSLFKEAILMEERQVMDISTC